MNNITITFGRPYKVLVPAKNTRPAEVMVHLDAVGEGGELVGVLLSKEQYDGLASAATAWTKVFATAELTDSGTKTASGKTRYNASQIQITGGDTPPFLANAKKVADFDHLPDPSGTTAQDETETKVKIGS